MAADGDMRKGVALVVGIGAYSHAEIAPLQFATRDARAVGKLLVHREIGRFPRDNVKLLLDRNASRDALVSRLAKWLRDTARGADLAVLYFAGHGMVQRSGQREEGFLLPTTPTPTT